MISILNKKTYFIVLTLLLLILPIMVKAETKDKNIVNIYFFHSRDCSHCNSEIKLLDALEKGMTMLKYIVLRCIIKIIMILDLKYKICII